MHLIVRVPILALVFQDWLMLRFILIVTSPLSLLDPAEQQGRRRVPSTIRMSTGLDRWPTIRPPAQLTRFCREQSIYYSGADCSLGCHLKSSKQRNTPASDAPPPSPPPPVSSARSLSGVAFTPKSSLWFFNFRMCTQSSTRNFESDRKSNLFTIKLTFVLTNNPF